MRTVVTFELGKHAKTGAPQWQCWSNNGFIRQLCVPGTIGEQPTVENPRWLCNITDDPVAGQIGFELYIADLILPLRQETLRFAEVEHSRTGELRWQSRVGDDIFVVHRKSQHFPSNDIPRWECEVAAKPVFDNGKLRIFTAQLIEPVKNLRREQMKGHNSSPPKTGGNRKRVKVA
ncbi:MAG: hypothetical protein A2653_00860 [Candidatus Zambryskibacteria bacterium RIFCSPHIGHO2_01_FULL_43_25]|uniref:Uncharacterized protein n=1 Tax=Candidatus Zambryskibacteria bacterium RIFCSPLOWO2_01_FULL_45_21 TaxID=1802761 RepID=A0A1G2U662_9BACT|nr:MAG: hypothetical protein A2653_00860 [Candidatus Zambryskibacteria bacterium RIFCSPHIGHO2_01_FULL_43_25]OHB00635.1 MAG: hypothetical protein A3E94_03340 [Candidatus Zambryskibacteria bacterium RIFCSPHIGHO2_12_FULL_44_12b]OHB04450.1 MAG: hypothetical protein A3B14_03385 [Candidatus Zambryskibacteria bacterium RIFCSPLOWO2_01_FULL_45_21]